MDEPQMYDTTIEGRIVADDDSVIACPTCGTETNLTVFGYPGEAATLMCENRHQFAPPPPFDAVRLLQEVAANPERTRLM